MARKVSSRVVLNRSKIGEVYLGVADGMLALAQRIVDEADVPDATPLGVGLIAEGGAAAWVNRKKIGGGAQKPRAVKLEKEGITAVAGFPFPGRFLETGTINMRAEPFFTPSVERVLPDAQVELSKGLKRRLARSGR